MVDYYHSLISHTSETLALLKGLMEETKIVIQAAAVDA